MYLEILIATLTLCIAERLDYHAQKRENMFYEIDNINRDSCTADKVLNVKYEDQVIGCGKQYDLSLFSTGKPPKLSFDRANINNLYTLLMVDPDAPTSINPTQKFWLHWMVLNIKHADLNTGEVIANYAPPTPPKGSGPHRYVFLLMKQRAAILPNLLNVTSRGKFDVLEFAKTFGISELHGFKYFLTEHP